MRGAGGRKRVEDLKKNKVVVEVVAGEEVSIYVYMYMYVYKCIYI
jgi:hypothetical protein